MQRALYIDREFAVGEAERENQKNPVCSLILREASSRLVTQPKIQIFWKAKKYNILVAWRQ